MIVMENEKIYLWSNGNPHASVDEYADELKKHDFSDGLNVFINACIPIQVNKDVFQETDNVSIHCGVAERNAKSGFLGYNEIQMFNQILRSSYVVDGGLYLWKLPKDGSLYENYKQYLSTGEFVCQIDESKFKPGCPTDKPWSCTTGFRTYFILKQLKQNPRIILVNFGVRDKKFEIYSKFHTIEYEDQYFNEHKVERLTV